MVLVESHPIETEAVHLLPRLQVLGVGAHRKVCVEVFPRQGIGKFVAYLEVFELLTIGEQIENEYFHRCSPRYWLASTRAVRIIAVMLVIR
jgi:hypothetical protein